MVSLNLGSFVQGAVQEADRIADRRDAEETARKKAEGERRKAEREAEKEKRSRFVQDRTRADTLQYRRDQAEALIAKEERAASWNYIGPFLKGEKPIYSVVQGDTSLDAEGWGETDHGGGVVVDEAFRAHALIAAGGNPRLANSYAQTAISTFGREQQKRDIEKHRKNVKFGWETEEEERKRRQAKLREIEENRKVRKAELDESAAELAEDKFEFEKKKHADEQKTKKGEISQSRKDMDKKIVKGDQPLTGKLIKEFMNRHSDIKRNTLLAARSRKIEDTLGLQKIQDKTQYVGQVYPIFSKQWHNDSDGNENHFTVPLREGVNNWKITPENETDNKRKDRAFRFLTTANNILKKSGTINERMKETIVNSTFGSDIKAAMHELSSKGDRVFNMHGFKNEMNEVIKVFSEDENFRKETEQIEKMNTAKKQAKTQEAVETNQVNVDPALIDAASTYTTSSDTSVIPSLAENAHSTLNNLGSLSDDGKRAFNEISKPTWNKSNNYNSSMSHLSEAVVNQTFTTSNVRDAGQKAQINIYNTVILSSVRPLYSKKGGTPQQRATSIVMLGRRDKKEREDFKNTKSYRDNDTLFNSSRDGITEINSVITLFDEAEAGEGYKNLADSFAIPVIGVDSFVQQVDTFTNWLSGKGDSKDIEIEAAENIIRNQGDTRFTKIALDTVKQAKEKSREVLKRKKGLLSPREYALAQRIEMAKVKLAYKMAGVFQGASSGSRTISDQDFKIILESLWGTTQKGTVQKLLELRSTLNTELLLAKAMREVGPLTPQYVHVVNRLQTALTKSRQSILNREISLNPESIKPSAQPAPAVLKNSIITVGDLSSSVRGLSPSTTLTNFTSITYETETKPLLDNYITSGIIFKELLPEVPTRTEEIMKYLGINSEVPKDVSDLINLNFAVLEFIKQKDGEWKQKALLDQEIINPQELNEFKNRYENLNLKSQRNIQEIANNVFGPSVANAILMNTYKEYLTSFRNKNGENPSESLQKLYNSEQFVNSSAEFINLDRATIDYEYNDNNLNLLKNLFGTSSLNPFSDRTYGLRFMPNLSLEDMEKLKSRKRDFDNSMITRAIARNKDIQFTP